MVLREGDNFVRRLPYVSHRESNSPIFAKLSESQVATSSLNSLSVLTDVSMANGVWGASLLNYRHAEKRGAPKTSDLRRESTPYSACPALVSPHDDAHNSRRR